MAGRIELKYLIDWRQRDAIVRAWAPFLVRAPFTNEYGVYPIMSLYFDSPSLTFYDEKLEGEMLRNKVRLRGYGYQWQKLSPLFLEIKRKIDSRIIKFRRKIPAFDRSLWEPRSWDLGSDHDAAQLSLLVERYRLRPAVQILYQREAYESPFFPSLRVAFDSNLVALHPGQEATPESFSDPRYRCMGEAQYVFEVKSNGGLPSWVMDGLRKAQVTQRAISKYCIGLEHLGLQHREIGVYT